MNAPHPRPSMFRPWGRLLSAVGLVLLVVSGCATRRAGEGDHAAAGAVQRLNMLCLPVVINLDRTPDADGFGVTIYASNARQPKAVPIKSGTLKILMFDGVVTAGDPQAEPLRTWTFTADDLELNEVVNSLGTGYRFALAWGEARPTQSRLSVQARYHPDTGPAIATAPMPIAMLAQ